MGPENRYPCEYSRTVPLKFCGILISNGAGPSLPSRAPSQVAPGAQAVVAALTDDAVGTARSRSPAEAIAAMTRRVREMVMSVLFYGSSLGVGASGRYVVFLAAPDGALVAVMTYGVRRTNWPVPLYWPM